MDLKRLGKSSQRCLPARWASAREGQSNAREDFAGSRAGSDWEPKPAFRAMTMGRKLLSARLFSVAPSAPLRSSARRYSLSGLPGRMSCLPARPGRPGRQKWSEGVHNGGSERGTSGTRACQATDPGDLQKLSGHHPSPPARKPGPPAGQKEIPPLGSVLAKTIGILLPRLGRGLLRGFPDPRHPQQLYYPKETLVWRPLFNLPAGSEVSSPVRRDSSPKRPRGSPPPSSPPITGISTPPQPFRCDLAVRESLLSRPCFGSSVSAKYPGSPPHNPTPARLPLLSS